MKYLLDTSALCAHFFGQPGGEEVGHLFADESDLGVCAVSWFEMRYVLRRCGVTKTDIDRALRIYRELPLETCSVTIDVVDLAVAIRDGSKERLPLPDALIAGCAATQGAILVHRDAHLDKVPDRLLKKLRLP